MLYYIYIFCSLILAGEVWGAIVVSVMVWGSVLWVLERSSHWITGRRYLSFSSSIFYGWGLLLEDHPFEPPPSPSSQVNSILILNNVYVCIVASVWAYAPRVPDSSPDIRWPLYFGITAEWPKITQIAAIHCPQTSLALLYTFEAVASNSLSRFQTSERT